MNRFFVNEKHENYFILNKETLKHLSVIRIGDNPFICVYDKKFYKCILEFDKAKIIHEINENHEFEHEVVVALSLIKYERFEWALQKLVELGATKIIPMVTEYTNGELYKFNKFEKKLERFQTILQNAAEQSFRNIIPELTNLHKFEDVIAMEGYKKIIAHEKQDESASIENNIDSNVLFLIGPEGGFSNNEIEVALNSNVDCVSLGKRILRAETAAIYMISKVKI
ncbi:16S rRNA (uracil(1498)-N(3))-methyltransferase [Mycoplasmopsis canis]|uniref:16S rRNA (uracil(1498)-N(3))-methyltransferase n=1 Tax=Mycoplasmopsis canis TaxID=29555 RepID=UPI00025AF39F|nr:16S rRNA (uracil(1498)-N(3))-methyltransferase [Mycoplasmopsis canis]EIE40171.1 16S ribosomal RNA methyltransferase RsmE [Mycoplasmopsis canis UF33]